MPSIAPPDSPARPSWRRLKTDRRPRDGEPFPINRRERSKLPFKREMHRGTMIALVGVATVIGAAIRLNANRSLTVNEIVTVNLAHLPFSTLITRLAHGGVYPPLHPVLEWCVVRLFGDAAFAVRLPALIAGVALIPAVAWLAAQLFDRRTAVVAGVFATLAPILVWYSQEASGYMLVALFGTLALVGAARASRTGLPADWALHAVAAAAAVWSDWSGILIVLAMELPLLIGALARRRAGAPLAPYLRDWALDTIAILCQLIPLALLFASQVRTHGGLAGVTNVSASGVTFYSTVSNGAWALFGFQPSVVTGVLSAVWPLAMLASLLMVGRGIERRSLLLTTSALIPALGVFVLGLMVPGSFDVRYFLAAVPPGMVLLARMTTGWPRSRTGFVLVAAGVALVFAGALVDQQRNPSNPRRFEYQRAFAQVQRDVKPNSAVFLLPSNLRTVIARDAPGVRPSRLPRQMPTRRQISNVFLVSSFSNQPPLLRQQDRAIGALRATRHLVAHHRYPGVSVWWFR